MLLEKSQFAPNQQRAGNTRERDEQQNYYKNPVTGVVDRGWEVPSVAPRKLAGGNHREPDNGLRGARENSRSGRVDRRADADQISRVKPLGAFEHQRDGAAGNQSEGCEYDIDVEEAQRMRHPR